MERPIVSQVVVIAVTADDHREFLGLIVGEQAFWTEFLRSLRSVALHGVRLATLSSPLRL
ncbi:transposase [Nonomuraea sp. NPDC050451]|uniref:transposase n=1 Tax=Nonomuraea sp. NPDC050451 TaxID=3364364 RepID=UPI0037B72AE8